MCNTRRPDLLSLPLSPLPSHVCLAWRCCRTVEIKTIQMYYDVFPSEGLGGEPGVWEKLGAETFQNYCQMGGFGPTSSNEKKKKKAMQNKQPSPLHGAAPCGAEPCRGGRRNRRSPAHPTRRHQRRLVPRPLKKGRQSREQQSS